MRVKVKNEIRTWLCWPIILIWNWMKLKNF